MSTLPLTPTHKAVQEHYGQAAREASSCCAAPAEPVPAPQENLLYPAELLEGLPADIVNFSAGSGDPITLAQLQPGESVLDLGSGGGLDCFLASRQVGPGGSVIGVEMTPEMLARARAGAARLGVTNVEFREGLLEALPVADASIDVVISNCVINLSPDKPQVLREMLRVLKPGGRIAISDMVVKNPVARDFSQDEEGWCGCSSGALTRGEYERLLEATGFQAVALEPNFDVIRKAILAGQAGLPEGITPEQALAEIEHWDQIKRKVVAPHKITARKA